MDFEALLFAYPDLVHPCKIERPVKHNVTHFINTASMGWSSFQSFLKKMMIADVLLITYPHCEVPTNFMTDASDTGIGAVLQQQINNEWKPIAFFLEAETC